MNLLLLCFFSFVITVLIIVKHTHAHLRRRRRRNNASHDLPTTHTPFLTQAIHSPLHVNQTPLVVTPGLPQAIHNPIQATHNPIQATHNPIYATPAISSSSDPHTEENQTPVLKRCGDAIRRVLCHLPFHRDRVLAQARRGASAIMHAGLLGAAATINQESLLSTFDWRTYVVITAYILYTTPIPPAVATPINIASGNFNDQVTLEELINPLDAPPRACMPSWHRAPTRHRSEPDLEQGLYPPYGPCRRWTAPA